MRQWHRRLAAALAFLVATTVVGRIWWVNEALPQIPLEYYEVGEWVELEGAFQSSSSEGTQGYSLMVESAEVVAYNEYLEKHGGELSSADEPGGAHCVVDVAVRIKNEGNGEGALNVFQMVLVPERSDEYLICDVISARALWPQVQEGAGMSVRIRPGTEYVVHIPYVFNGMDEVYEREVEDRSFTLLVSRMPVRKMIRISADG